VSEGYAATQAQDTAMLTHALTAVALAVTFAILARAFPARPREAQSAFDVRELERVYNRHSLTVVFASVVAGYVVWVVLAWIGRIVLAPREPGEVLWSPSGVFWILPSVFLGLIAGALFVDGLLRSRDEALAEALQDFESRRHGVDFRRLERPLIALLLLASGAYVALMLGWSVRFRPEAIVEDPFLPGRVLSHRYTDVREVRLTPRKAGGVGARERLDLAIRFADGHELRSGSAPSDEAPDSLRRVATLVASRAGVPVSEPGAGN